MAEVQQQKKAPPVARAQAGGVQGAVWRKETDRGIFYSATFENRYKDGETWKSTDSYGHIDLLYVQEVARQMYADIEAMRTRDKAAGKQQQRQPGEEA